MEASSLPSPKRRFYAQDLRGVRIQQRRVPVGKARWQRQLFHVGANASVARWRNLAARFRVAPGDGYGAVRRNGYPQPIGRYRRVVRCVWRDDQRLLIVERGYHDLLLKAERVQLAWRQPACGGAVVVPHLAVDLLLRPTALCVQVGAVIPPQGVVAHVGCQLAVLHGRIECICWRREIATIFCREYLTNFCRKSRSQQNK